MQKKISDLIKDLYLTNNTAEPFIQVYNSGIFCMTCERDSISLTAKRFWPVLHNTGWNQCLENFAVLMVAMNNRQFPQEWQLFIHLSMHTLKAVFLYRRSILPSIPVVYTFTIINIWRHDWNSQPCKLEDFQWHICGDLKLIVILMGLQRVT